MRAVSMSRSNISTVFVNVYEASVKTQSLLVSVLRASCAASITVGFLVVIYDATHSGSAWAFVPVIGLIVAWPFVLFVNAAAWDFLEPHAFVVSSSRASGAFVSIGGGTGAVSPAIIVGASANRLIDFADIRAASAGSVSELGEAVDLSIAGSER